MFWNVVLFNLILMVFHVECFELLYQDLNTSWAEEINRKVQISCAVLTNAKYHKTRVPALLSTWGKRCNKLVVISDESDSSVPVRRILPKHFDAWARAREAYKTLHNDKGHNEWFLKTHDDVFVVMENLRYFLINKQEEHFGRVCYEFPRKGFKPQSKVYVNKRQTYLMNYQALSGLVSEAFTRTECPMFESGDEESSIAACMRSANVTMGQPTYGDQRNLYISVPNNMEDLNHDVHLKMLSHNEPILSNSSVYDVIIFNDVTKNQFYFLEYLLYKVHVYGVNLAEEYSLMITLSGRSSKILGNLDLMFLAIFILFNK